MITLSNISYEISGQKLLNNIKLTITPSDKIGLIGINGAGKSTLLKIISQEIKPQKGRIQIKKGTKVYYLPQEVVRPQNLDITIFDYVKGAFEELYEKEKELLRINKEIEKDNGQDIKLIKYQSLLEEKLREAGFYEINSKIKKVLIGLGFRSDSFYKPISTLSGGWLMRLELSKIILSDPDIVLLDEPINHLDEKSALWLKNFLINSNIGYIIVAHDRDFLNEVSQEIWELEKGKIIKFKGNFDYYIQHKKRLIKAEEKNRKKLEKRIKEINRFIERFRAKATKAKQVQSRIKLLEKITIEEDKQNLQKDLALKLPLVKRPGKVVLELKSISKSFEGKTLLSNVSFLIKRGQKVALIGPNGVGKSTLLKIIAKRLPPERGEVIIGHNVISAYFAQHQTTELPEELSILEVLKLSNPSLSETKLRTILGILMFREDDVYKKVSVLSGGEKSRLALAKVMAKGANLLLLDEPTNHLDMNSKNALKMALKEFEGSLLIVSHDYDFLNGLVDSILEFKEGTVVFSPVDIENLTTPFSENNLSKRATVESKKLNKRDKRRLISAIRQEKSRATSSLKQRMQQIEKTIEKLEQEKEHLEKKLTEPSLYSQKSKFLDTNKRYNETKRQLDNLYEKWEKINYEFEEKSQFFDKKISKISEKYGT